MFVESSDCFNFLEISYKKVYFINVDVFELCFVVFEFVVCDESFE